MGFYEFYHLNLDTVMLGFLKDNAAVGYYTAAVKLSKMLMGVCSSLHCAASQVVKYGSQT